MNDFNMTKCILISVIFSPHYQCGFRKGDSTQHYLLAITEKMEEARDNNKIWQCLLIAFCTISLLQSYMPLVLILSP